MFYKHFAVFEIGFAVDVTGKQGMITPPKYMIPLEFRQQ
jgi:hypothetical protein